LLTTSSPVDVRELEEGALLSVDPRQGNPRNKLKLVEAWIEIHRDELMADWELAASGQTIFQIDPLK
jgi:hypothetical protein